MIQILKKISRVVILYHLDIDAGRFSVILNAIIKFYQNRSGNVNIIRRIICDINKVDVNFY